MKHKNLNKYLQENFKNICTSCNFQIVLMACTIAIFVKNILNTLGIAAISPLYSENGMIGIVLFTIIGFFIYFYNENDAIKVNYIKSCTVGIAFTSCILNCSWPVLCLIGLFYIFYVYICVKNCNLMQGYITVLSFISGIEIISLIMLLSGNPQIRLIDKIICSVVTDVLFVIVIAILVWKNIFKKIVSKVLRNKFLFIVFLFVECVFACLALYGLIEKKYILIIPKTTITVCFLMFCFFAGLKAVDIFRKRNGFIREKLDESIFIPRLMLVTAAILIFNIYIANIYVQDGAVEDGYNYEWFSKIAKLFGMGSPALLYRCVIVLNALLVFFQFIFIKKTAMLGMSVLADNLKKFNYKECLMGNEVALPRMSMLIAFTCVLTSEMLCQQRWAENFICFLFEMSMWMLIYFFIKLMIEKDIKVCTCIIIAFIMATFLYVRIQNAFSNIPGLAIQILIILGAVVIIFYFDIWLSQVTQFYMYEEECYLGERLLLVFFGVAIVFAFVKSASPLHNLIEKQNNYDEIQKALENVLVVADGQIYYDSTVDETVKFVISEHMLYGKEDDNFENTSVDKEGYRLVELSNRDLMHSIIEAGKYKSVFVVNNTLMATQSPKIEDALEDTEYATENIEYLTLDNIKIDLNGWSTKYKNIDLDAEPNADSEIEGYVFRLCFNYPDEDNVTLYNIDDFSLDYHLYQDGKLISYDHKRVAVPDLITDECTADMKIYLEDIVQDENKLADFDPNQEYEIVIDMVHEGVEWLSELDPEACLTFVHNVDGSWQMKR